MAKLLTFAGSLDGQIFDKFRPLEMSFTSTPLYIKDGPRITKNCGKSMIFRCIILNGPSLQKNHMLTPAQDVSK